MDQTLLQFGQAQGASAPTSEVEASPRAATVCPVCAQHFSADGRFCPFDGEPLRAAPDWDPNADPLLGTVVDNRYEVLSVLGEGGMGVVYETRHRALGKRFALKVLRKDLASDAEIAARFIQEARTAASLSHPGLVEITDFGRLATGQPFFVMEFLGGQSLATLIRRGGPIPAARAVDILRQIAQALAAAHDRSIVHRDLKPDNIHISPAAGARDRVTIVDFGLAKVVGASRLTRAGMVFGTPHYMSPEQAMGEATDQRADVYALGVVMYEMLTGHVPFEADSYMGVLTKHMYMAPTPPSQLPGMNRLGVLEDITLRCLEKKPEHRYGALRELVHDLDVALDATGERPSVGRERRAAPHSLLADELELPGRDERPVALSAGVVNPLPWLPILFIGLLFLAGTGGVLAWRKSATPTALRRSPVELPAGAPSAAAGASLHAPANPVSAPQAVPPERAAAAVAEPVRGRGAAVVRAVPQMSHAALPPPKKRPERLGNSEIVDPWAK